MPCWCHSLTGMNRQLNQVHLNLSFHQLIGWFSFQNIAPFVRKKSLCFYLFWKKELLLSGICTRHKISKQNYYWNILLSFSFSCFFESCLETYLIIVAGLVFVLWLQIPDSGIRAMILHMIQLDPESRLPSESYLQSYASVVFPSYFSPFLHKFFSCLSPHDSDTRVRSFCKLCWLT